MNQDDKERLKNLVMFRMPITDKELGEAMPWIVGFVLISFIVLILFWIFTPTDAHAETGTASYYTKASCIREGTSGIFTASGEPYDENAMTCAMRRRDFGGLYNVCNVDNGKCVVVRQNDFGPNKKLHAAGRIVDLSKGAFRKIAPPRKGLVNVTVEPVSAVRG